MGLTGKRGGQTEGKAATQHHCQITVGSFVLKHRSPRERVNEDSNRDKGGRGQREREERLSVNIEKRIICQVLPSVVAVGLRYANRQIEII